MARKISICYKVTASAGAEDKTSIYTVEAGKRFKLESCYVSFPAGTYYELELAFYYGDKKIAPEENNYVGDNQNYEDVLDFTIESGESLLLYYKNNNTTNTKEAFIIVRGVLE